MIALVSAALVHAVTFPSEASCPAGMYANGIRPTGETECLSAPPRGACDTRGGCDSEWRARSVPMRIYCPRGQRPVVITERRVGCRP